MDTSLGLLLERLRWPVPRIRWEAARQLAALIRIKQEGVLDALIEWTAGRTLESECLLGLSVLYAFRLNEFCPEDLAKRMVAKPSPASDWMLKATYNTRERGSSFRYNVSHKASAHLSDNTMSQFDWLNTTAVPPIFLNFLQYLEDNRNFGFIDRWRHDWAWICRSHSVEPPEPRFFTGPGQQNGATLHLLHSEILVSAYLRTLAYAMHIGKIQLEHAENYSLLALPISRSLADLEPVNRPVWSRNLLQRWQDSKHELINEIWLQAGGHTLPGEMPAALYLVEADEKAFVEIEVDVVAGYGTFYTEKPEADLRNCNWEGSETGCMDGETRLRDDSLGILTRPMKLACQITPEYLGRIDAAVALRARLACLELWRNQGSVQCRKDNIELNVNTEVVSRWYHWYSNWEPSKSTQLDSDLSGLTTCQRSRFHEYTNSSNLSVAILARVRVGAREYKLQNFSIEDHTFWVDLPDSETISLSGNPIPNI